MPIATRPEPGRGQAGRGLGQGGRDDSDWERSFAVHVLAHVHVARVLAPPMAARGRGHLLLTRRRPGC